MTRNIGIPIKESVKKSMENDYNNPFNGSLSVRGKIFEGIVIKAKAKRTVTLEKESPIYFTKFKKTSSKSPSSVLISVNFKLFFFNIIFRGVINTPNSFVPNF